MKIVIIGNGIAGITSARHIRKMSDHEILVVSGETKHFFSRTALMYVYMGHMRFKDIKPYEDGFWEKNNIQLKRAWVHSIEAKGKSIELQNGESISYDKLIIACGSKSNKFGWPGQDLPGVQGLYSYQDLELLEANTQDIRQAVIVGGGLIGIELAEMLHSRHIPVTFLVREKEYWDNVLPKQEAKLIGKHIREHGFELLLETELKAIHPGSNGRVEFVETNTGETIKCELVGLTAGVSPNIDWLKDSVLETKRGILVNHFFETNIEDIYAIGDCVQFYEPLSGRRPIEQVWYTGRIHAETLAKGICKERTAYQPGPWFNSAKFLDIEYQTYGTVMPQLREGEEELYWEHEDSKKCIHIIYEGSSGLFIGINVFGIRYRHILFDQWLQEKRSVDYVLQHLGAANFDPEFYAHHEKALIAQYNSANPGKEIDYKRSGLLKDALKLLKLPHA